ncbi:hypothetical protein CDD81_6993 [Ophiocordyceps australis]|uniref:acetyl-CoA C-acyltransferase n=1 Tax=Ophiocordyceps australis TaxID=1399860 RepID=A0A2C5XLN6_9HYPO|nr:hypothetical protein CDD81_6993 [Ophiocordyceps australis]
MEAAKGVSAILTARACDIVIVSALRTPVCRAYRGALRDSYAEELLARVLGETRARFPEVRVDEVTVGVVLSELGGSKAARAAACHEGFAAQQTRLSTVNRACASSLQAVASVAAQLRVGDIEVGVAAGMESMTRNYGTRAVPRDAWPELRQSSVKEARDCFMPMGLTAENVAARFGVSRQQQDEFAAQSHQRAARARAEGRFEAETVAVRVRHPGGPGQDEDGGDDRGGGRHGGDATWVRHDDGIRDAVTPLSLAQLKPAFTAHGSCTAGNSSQMSDGAAALLLVRRSTAVRLGLAPRILGRFISATTAGCAPDQMGTGPIPAVQALLARHSLTVADVALWEMNEAFASQAVYCLRQLGLEHAWAAGRVNPHGGAIALGHPLGATGARLVCTLLHALEPHQLGIVTMCVGTGMGMAGLFAAE